MISVKVLSVSGSGAPRENQHPATARMPETHEQRRLENIAGFAETLFISVTPSRGQLLSEGEDEFAHLKRRAAVSGMVQSAAAIFRLSGKARGMRVCPP
jgi:hypothetical protein